MMTLSTPLIWRLPPVMPASRPTPTMVVLAGTNALMAAAWFFAEAARASSCR